MRCSQTLRHNKLTAINILIKLASKLKIKYITTCNASKSAQDNY